MDAVVFDLDGTLIDSFGDLVAAVMREMGTHTSHSRENELKARFGQPLPQMLGGMVPTVQLSGFVAAVRSNLHDRYLQGKITFMPGAIAALEILSERGYNLAIASNKPQQQVDAIVQNSPLKNLIKVAFGLGNPELSPKPSPDLILAVKNCLPQQNLIFVGDSKEDLMASKSAKVAFVGFMSEGNEDSQMIFREQPGIYSISHFSELPGVVERIKNGQ